MSRREVTDKRGVSAERQYRGVVVVKPSVERLILRRVFSAWSIEIPPSFEETLVQEKKPYWHAWDEHRSVSLTSISVADDAGPVSADRLLEEMAPMPGEHVEELPEGGRGWAITDDAPRSSRASRLLSGLLVARGRVLIATITSDDPAWRRRVWLSIRAQPPH